jgi:hypothetical protein
MHRLIVCLEPFVEHKGTVDILYKNSLLKMIFYTKFISICSIFLKLVYSDQHDSVMITILLLSKEYYFWLEHDTP